VLLGPRRMGTAAEAWGSEADMADVEENEMMGEAEDITMAETAKGTPTETENRPATDTRALATNDCSHPAQLRWVVQVDHFS